MSMDCRRRLWESAYGKVCSYFLFPVWYLDFQFNLFIHVILDCSWKPERLVIFSSLAKSSYIDLMRKIQSKKKVFLISISFVYHLSTVLTPLSHWSLIYFTLVTDLSLSFTAPPLLWARKPHFSQSFAHEAPSDTCNSPLPQILSHQNHRLIASQVKEHRPFSAL